MPLCHFADLVDCHLIDSFVRSREMLPNKWLPLFLRDRAEGIVSSRSIKRPVFIEHHLLNQMFATAEKHVTHGAMILNHAAQFARKVLHDFGGDGGGIPDGAALTDWWGVDGAGAGGAGVRWAARDSFGG